MKRVEDRLQTPKVRCRTMIDRIPVVAWAASADGSVEFVNRRWMDFAGLSSESLQGTGWTVTIHPEDLERVGEVWRKTLQSGEPGQIEIRIRRFDGVYRWFLVRATPSHDEYGKIIQWFGTNVDIEELNPIKPLKDRRQDENAGQTDQPLAFEGIVGASSAIKTVVSAASRVAPTEATVLLVGETGTGKELFARAIHKHSHRSRGPFVSINCAAIPQALIASELFGHEKGAFTGAHQRRAGRFELAEGGTLFLDEVGDLPVDAQVALLRVLQERQFERVGGSQPIKADVRVIAATNRDLRAAVAAGTFRSDLFYRLNVFPIEIPPLSERQGDIPLLVEHFINRSVRKAGKKITGIDKQSMNLLAGYSWPGNIRELQNVIERAVIVCDSPDLSIDRSWVSPPTLPGRETGPLDLFKRIPVEEEKAMIEAALRESGGRVYGPSGAASRLAIPRSTLESKIKSLKINKHLFKTGAPLGENPSRGD